MQEDSENLSRRAQRRAQGSAPESAGDSTAAVDPEGLDLDADDEGSEAEQPAAPNRKARRAAAAEARARRKQELADASAIGLDTTETVDDVMARTTEAASRLLRTHWPKLQWVIVAGAVAWVVQAVVGWRSQSQAAVAGDALMRALSARTTPTDEDSADKPGAPARSAEQIQASATALATIKSDLSQKAQALAELSLASLKLELGQTADAEDGFSKSTERARAEALDFFAEQARLGVALSLEAKGDIDGAVSRVSELKSEPALRSLASYHRARLLKAKGDLAAAKEELKELLRDMPAAKSGGEGNPRIEGLREKVHALVLELDPLQKDLLLPTPQFDEESLRRMLEQMAAQGNAGQAPGAPAPTGQP